MKARSTIPKHKKDLKKIIPCEYSNFRIVLDILNRDRIRTVRFSLLFYSNIFQLLKGMKEYNWYFVDQVFFKSSNNYAPEHIDSDSCFRDYFLSEKQIKWFTDTCNRYMRILLNNGLNISRL